MDITRVRELARMGADKMPFEVRGTLKETLRTIHWTLGEEVFSQDEVARMNLVLDSASCLGRLAVCAAIAEEYFPNVRIAAGEVLQDMFRDMALDMLRKSGPEESLLREILLYEEPHAVLLVNSDQYDPIADILDMTVVHARIKEFPIWKFLAAAVTVSEANLESDILKRRRILEEAECMCPGMALVEEAMVGAMSLLEGYDVKAALKWCYERRPTARTLVALYLATQDSAYRDRLNEVYSSAMLKIILAEAGM